MRRTARSIVLALAALGACTGPTVPKVGSPDVERAQLRDPGVTRASLEQGRSLYLGRCSSCHEPFAPATRTLPEWQHEVDEMRERSGIDDHAADLILAYLGTFAAPAPAIN